MQSAVKIWVLYTGISLSKIRQIENERKWEFFSVKLYEQLSKYSNPAAYIKDVLRGLLPIPGQINVNIPNSKSNDEKIEDDEDLMDI